MPASPFRSTRADRHRCILEAIEAETVHSQAELGRLLGERGHAVNQATLSRDLRELGVWKGPDGYALPTESVTADELTKAVRSWLLEARAVGNQCVLRTPPSSAPPMALAIDEAELEDVVGTIAGDDTVLVICATPNAANRFSRSLLNTKASNGKSAR